jgi:excisionase family DNA binding protein
MRTGTSVRKSETYLPDEESLADVINLSEVMASRGQRAPEPRPVLDDGQGHRVELPKVLYAVLRQVTQALSAGMGVTIAPYGARLTTQEAADFLGMSRPTLVRLLENGTIPFEMCGRHRRVALHDLADYQEQRHRNQRRILDDMVAQSEADGFYEAPLNPRDVTRLGASQ